MCHVASAFCAPRCLAPYFRGLHVPQRACADIEVHASTLLRQVFLFTAVYTRLAGPQASVDSLCPSAGCRNTGITDVSYGGWLCVGSGT